MPKTSQPSPNEFYNIFSKIARDKKDILYIGVSSGFSGTHNSADLAKKMLLEEIPEARIEIVDVLTASLGQGMMVKKAKEMQDKGATIEEVVDYLENIKWNLNTFIMVDDLIHLKRGGRISSAVAFFGSMLSLKPLISINNEGKVEVIHKARGRKAGLKDLTKYIVDKLEDIEDNILAIGHCNALEDAKKLKDLILEKRSFKEISIGNIGPVIGAYGGPGALAVFFVGKPRFTLAGGAEEEAVNS